MTQVGPLIASVVPNLMKLVGATWYTPPYLSLSRPKTWRVSTFNISSFAISYFAALIPEREVGCNSIDQITKLYFWRHHQYKYRWELFAGKKPALSAHIPNSTGAVKRCYKETGRGGAASHKKVFLAHILISITVFCIIIYEFAFPDEPTRRNRMKWCAYHMNTA